MRHLKYHEQKLLRKVDLLDWKGTSSQREHLITQRFKLEDRETYVRYSLVVGKIRRLALALAKLNDNDDVKIQMVKELVAKLHTLGLVKGKSLLDCAKVGVSSFCRRRLSTIVADLKMVPDIKTAANFIKHGHIKVGTQIINDPGLIISRAMEDYITWREGSKIKATIEQFTDD
ncbi:U3 small nucleolar ribonucleoprotein IMP3 [Nematocida homosporus]|uniref:U3 small nucleolar ribonucleoprotein IMP3 n=1 Tax=Nematocida homosporus TaxID=1912981 RepID=UPI00221FE969|nr:U3 small nucleolar ribonucleoprotein IMP3 [Nematocida homosporus]KAI5185876.1 U3 small nucleolar ribonucleoprotein IMP3 [Nematocida homosporus]